MQPPRAKKNVSSSDVQSESHPRPSVLIVEDEQDLQELLRYNLAREGYRVNCVDSGEAGLRTVKKEKPDVVLLDLMLPGMDGLEVCRALKADSETANIPVLMVTAKGEEADVVAGLELGADDYITKPFSPRVLIARLKAVLRRTPDADSQGSDPADASIVRIKDIVIDVDRHEVRVEGKSVELTMTEFRLLHLLAGRPGRVFTRSQIIHLLHGGLAAVTDRSVDVQIVSLRRKLGAVGKEIQTVRGVGYRFND